MNYARELLFECNEAVQLERPVDLMEIRDAFARIGVDVSIALAPDGVARVSFGRPVYPHELLQFSAT